MVYYTVCILEVLDNDKYVLHKVGEKQCVFQYPEKEDRGCVSKEDLVLRPEEPATVRGTLRAIKRLTFDVSLRACYGSLQ